MYHLNAKFQQVYVLIHCTHSRSNEVIVQFDLEETRKLCLMYKEAAVCMWKAIFSIAALFLSVI